MQDKLKSKLSSIPTKATEAIVLNQAVIHYSKANTTNNIRLAITTGIKSKEAPMIFHYWDKNEPKVIEQFKQEDDFLIRFTDFHKSIFLRPEIGESIGKKSFQLHLANDHEINNLISQQAETPNKTFFQKIKQWVKK